MILGLVQNKFRGNLERNLYIYNTRAIMTDVPPKRKAKDTPYSQFTSDNKQLCRL
jgi:hypothetical protein